jgi:hypothetical protein
MKRELSVLIYELRPYIIKYLQDVKVTEYIELYETKNGVKPNQEDINNFITILISHGIVTKDADEIIDDLIHKYKARIFLSKIPNTAFTIAAITIYIVYILIYLSSKNIRLVDEHYLISAPNFIASCALLLFTIVSYAVDIIKK